MNLYSARLAALAALCGLLTACSAEDDGGRPPKPKTQTEWPVPPSADAANVAAAANAVEPEASNVADNASAADDGSGAVGPSPSSGSPSSEEPERQSGDKPGAKPTGRSERAPGRSAPYRAIGTEPFWSATIDDDVLTLEMPDMLPRRYGVIATHKGGTVRYQGDGVLMSVTPGTCSDGMSDDAWSDRVQIAMSDRVLKGCGGMRWSGVEQ